jgi:hypothetical protein
LGPSFAEAGGASVFSTTSVRKYFGHRRSIGPVVVLVNYFAGHPARHLKALPELVPKKIVTGKIVLVIGNNIKYNLRALISGAGQDLKKTGGFGAGG